MSQIDISAIKGVLLILSNRQKELKGAVLHTPKT